MIVLLIIFNEDIYNNHMFLIQQEYYKKMNELYEFKYFFIMFKQLQDKEYLLDENNILIINGNESYIPGILQKTLLAMEIVTTKLNIKYEYLLRTNISTFINFKEVFKFISNLSPPLNNESECNNPPLYYIGKFMKLTWENKCYGTEYCGGAFILLNRSIVMNIISNIEHFVYDVIDDVSIGEYISRIKEQVIKINIFDNIIFNYIEFNNTNPNDYNNFMAITNNYNKENRQLDIDRLQFLINNYLLYDK
jgi:hypothetical protein